MTNSMRGLPRSCFRGAVLAAVCGALLVGCGGGSDDDDQAKAPEPMPPTMEEMAVGERARINSAIATARSAVGAVGDDATDAQVTAAEKALSDLQATINAASNVPEHERNAHTATHDVIEADLTAAKMSRQMAMDAADDRMQEDAMKMAEETRTTARKLFHAIERDREFDAANHLRLTKNVKGFASGLNEKLEIVGGLDPDAVDEVVTTAGPALDGSTSPLNVYRPHPDGLISPTSELPALAGWKGREYRVEHDCEKATYSTGCMEGITDHLVIYTNQADAEPVDRQTFAERYGVDSDNDGTLDNEWYKPATDTQNAYITTAGLDKDTGLANWLLIASPEFSTAGIKLHPESMKGIRGTFDGAAGVYTCTDADSDACRSERLVGTADTSTPPEGTPYVRLRGGGTGGWTFVPDNANAIVTMAEAEAPDEMVYYGWWAREMSGDDGWLDVRPLSEIRQGGVPHGNGVAKNINGNATYTGGAAGKYAIYHPVAAGSSAGAWTAAAMLKADFSENTISGELTGFMSDGQPMDWTVELLEADGFTAVDPDARSQRADGGGFMADGGGHGFSNAENGTVWTMGGTAGEKAGSWYGDFWMANDHPDDQTTLDDNLGRQPAPAAATGVFWAEHGDTAKMTGAFGVTRDEEN